MWGSKKSGARTSLFLPSMIFFRFVWKRQALPIGIFANVNKNSAVLYDLFIEEGSCNSDRCVHEHH